jgi:hypothetical protein
MKYVVPFVALTSVFIYIGLFALYYNSHFVIHHWADENPSVIVTEKMKLIDIGVPFWLVAYRFFCPAILTCELLFDYDFMLSSY